MDSSPPSHARSDQDSLPTASAAPDQTIADGGTTVAADDGGEEKKGEANGGSEVEEECGFCLFMKGGGCKDAFVAWEKCMQEAEKRDEDIVDKCSEAAALLKRCMDAHPDYYEPILRAEQALADSAAAAAANDRDSEDEKKKGKHSVSTLHFTVGVVAKDPDLIFLLELWINSAALLLMVFVLVTAAVGGTGCGSATAAGGAGMGTAFSGALGTVVLPGFADGGRAMASGSGSLAGFGFVAVAGL
ncbi:unnamed protein product [Musa hybrid cultivar]